MVSFQINAEDLPPLEAFHYLRQKITYNNSNWPAVYQNLQKAQRWWCVIARLLKKTKETVRACWMNNNTVAKLVILYVSDRWVVTGEMLKVLEGFHHQVARRITGMTATLGAVRE